MTRYRYTASDLAGQTQRGVVEAASIEQARALVRAKGLMVTQIRTAQAMWHVGFSLLTRSRLSPTEIAVFTRQMATLLENGVQVEHALAALEAQSTKRVTELCRTVRQAVLDGSSLSDALNQCGQGFDRFYLASVAAAERAGRQGAVLAYLADHVEARLRNRQTVSLAMIYPVILIVVSIAVVAGLLVFLLPDIVRVFSARGADLPPLTTAMIRLSDILSAYGLLLLVVLGGVFACGMALVQKPEIRLHLHALLWRVGLARQITLVQFTGTLATLTQSGVPLAEALSSATATVSNLEARRILTEAAQKVRDGAALSRALQVQRGFPPMMVTMIASGEASGALPRMLGRFAQDQSQVLQARVKALVGLVEPMVLLIMGGVVMLLVLAILLPIVSLNSLVG